MNVVWYRKYFCLYIFLYALVLSVLCTKTVDAQENGAAIKRVTIDPGHGGRDPGALGARSKEKDIVLDISLRLGKMIKDNYPDVEVIYTRKTDVLIDLDKRADIANKANADLFISVHANASASRCPAGTETLVMGNTKAAANLEVAKRENSAILFEDDYSTRYAGFDPTRPESYMLFDIMQFANLEQSINFANEVQYQFKNYAKRGDRSVKQSPVIVLWKTTMPSVLVEVGFICNAEEERYMNSEAGKQQLTTSIFRAFSAYKAKIDGSSSFIPNGQTSGATQAKPAASEKVVFCIQISSSTNPVETDPNNFKKYTNVERIEVSQKLYKYVVNRSNSYEAAQENLKKVRNDFSDAFIVCIADGKIVSVAEGLRIIAE